MKILSVCSARPNFVKLAAVHHALADRKLDGDHIIVHTGQHHDALFSDVFFTQLEIPLPTINLGIHGGSNEEQQKRVEEACASVFASEKPNIILVYGDVNGAAAAARAAQAAGIPLAHVEAGLRSFDLAMPEEHNRMAIDKLSQLLFVTEQSGLDNIAKEKLTGKPFLVGNTMIDTLVRMLPVIETLPMPIKMPEKYAVVTLHRPSNVDDESALHSIVNYLLSLNETIPLVFPLHRRTQARLEQFGLLASLTSRVQCIDPLPYLSFLRLVQGAHFVLTDSGGIQEETTYLQKKCFTARPNTERPVTIEIGSNELVDLSSEDGREVIAEFAVRDSHPVGQIPPLWDGKTGERIVGILLG